MKNLYGYGHFYAAFSSNGWQWEESSDDCDAYWLNVIAGYNCKCIAHGAMHKSQLSSSGHYGVAWIEVVFENDPPYTIDDLECMKNAIEMAENNLLLIGIPFCPDYEFQGRNRANKKRRNAALRRKWKLDGDKATPSP